MKMQGGGRSRIVWLSHRLSLVVLADSLTLTISSSTVDILLPGYSEISSEHLHGKAL